MKVVICEDCKRYWIMPVSQCSCGSRSLVETSLHNYIFAENENRFDYFGQSDLPTKASKIQKIKDVSYSYILFTLMLWFTSSFPMMKVSFPSLNWHAIIGTSVWIAVVMTFLTVIVFRLHAIIKHINEKED